MVKEINFITKEWDIDELQTLVSKKFLSDNTSEKLRNELSSRVHTYILENPYIDKDFRDTYYNDFSKRYQEIERNSIRIHLFTEQKEYYGFFTLRDTSPFNIGRSYLHPKAIKHSVKGYYCLERYEVNLLGLKLHVIAFPWMQQDVNVTRCAHIAMWTLLRYFSNKISNYKEYTLQNLSNLSDSNSRKVPSRGLTVEQIAQTITRAGFSTEIYYKATIDPILFHRICYSMIESGLPFVAGLLKKNHAISIIGHLPIDIPLLKVQCNTCSEQIIDIADYIPGFISINDNFLPYLPITNSSNTTVAIDDIDVIIAPLHEKMYLDIIHLYTIVIPSIEKLLNPSQKLVRRVFLTTSKSLKNSIAKSKDPIYKDENLKLLMPKFVWIIEYFEIEEYPATIIHRFVIDASGVQYKTLDLLLSSKMEQNLYINDQLITLNEKSEYSCIGNLKEVP